MLTSVKEFEPGESLRRLGSNSKRYWWRIVKLSQTAFSPPHACILVLRSFPRATTVNKLASVVLGAVAQLARLVVSNRVYRLDPSGLGEGL